MRTALKGALCVLLSALLAVGTPAFALGPFEKNHPLVAEGLAAYESGQYEKALEKFDAAKKELPASAALEFNRGNALYKLGRLQEAKEVFEAVAESGKGELRQKDFYNLGTTLAAMGEEKAAISALKKALVLDPKDEQARHNLEVLLRRIPPKKPEAPDGGAPDGGQPDAGDTDGGQDAGSDGGAQDGGSDGGPSDGGADAGSQGAGGDGGSDGGTDGGPAGQGEGQKDGGQGHPQAQDGGQPDRADGGSDAGAQAHAEQADAGMSQAELSKQQAEKLLDSLKSSERNMQLWRFQQKRKRPVEKDW